MLLCVAIFAVAITFQIKIPGEALLVILCVPRLHDLGRSGWWVVLPILCEIAAVFGILFMPAPPWPNDVMAGVATLAGYAIVLIPALVLLFIPGQRDSNRFGPAPAPGFGRLGKVKTS
jgi:uncharacterized membrane protein YhaH (DUF805 family)